LLNYPFNTPRGLVIATLRKYQLLYHFHHLGHIFIGSEASSARSEIFPDLTVFPSRQVSSERRSFRLLLPLYPALDSPCPVSVEPKVPFHGKLRPHRTKDTPPHVPDEEPAAECPCRFRVVRVAFWESSGGALAMDAEGHLFFRQRYALPILAML